MNPMNGTEVALNGTNISHLPAPIGVSVVDSTPSVEDVNEANDSNESTEMESAKSSLKIVYVSEDAKRKLKCLSALADCFMAEMLERLIDEKYKAAIQTLR